MATFPRTVLPSSTSALFMPGALIERTHTGVQQIRATKAAGWSWTEDYPPLSAANPSHMALYAFIQKSWARGQIHDYTHLLTPGSGRAKNGVGTGTILVDGAAQSGDTILTDGWTINTPNSVRAGDVLKIAGDNAVYMAASDAGSNGVGEVTIELHMPLRLAPADGAAVTLSGVTFRATIINRPQFPDAIAPIYFGGLSLTLAEAL